MKALVAASVVRNLAISVRDLSEQEIWLEAYDGNFAAQARAQGLLESISGVFAFVLNPTLGAVSDSFGRKPLMNFAPVVSTFSCSLMAWRPAIPALVFRRFCSPLANTPWHSGENACLADLFKGDSASYGLAKGEINTMISVTKIFGPILGGYLGAISPSLPWWVSAFAFAVMATIIKLFVHETLEPAHRVPFKWRRSSNPLSFLALFRRGPRLRTLVCLHIWRDIFGGRRATHRYEHLHLTQRFGWAIAERVRYSSFRSFCDVPANALSGRLLHHIGVEKALILGQATAIIEQMLAGLASTGWHFYLLQPFRITVDVGQLALDWTATSIGAESKIPQGELQAALNSISKLVGIGTPLLWATIYAYGVRIGVPSLFYYASAAGGIVQMAMLRVLISMQ